MTQTHEALAKEVCALKIENAALRAEVGYLKTHTTLAAGLRGERLVLEKLGGKLTSYAASHDLDLESGQKLEIKYSKLHSYNRLSPETLRWTWNKVLGFRDKGKDYDFLVLVGEKDERYKKQYKGIGPYVYFLIPKAVVKDITTHGRLVGANTNLTTNFSTVRSVKAKLIIEHMIDPEFMHLLESCSSLYDREST